MAINERVRKAFLAARACGISDQEVKPVLKHLLKLYNKNWDLIESEGYRALLDAYFELNENKGVGGNKNVLVENGESSRLSKRLCMQELEDQASCTVGNSTPKLSSEENEKPMINLEQGVRILNKNSSGCSNSGNKVQQQSVTWDKKRPIISDITKGTENVKISLVDETGNQDPPKFTYLRKNVIYQEAYVHISLARIADEHCCSSCSGDCLSFPIPCACAQETGGEFAYTPEGQLREEFLRTCQKHHLVHCQDCPLERCKNERKPEKCKGHLVRKFIKECWDKCGCDKQCGNRVVQRGIVCKLQVFFTGEGKGWGLKTLQDLPKGTFVCEYVGEIVTNTELHERNKKSSGRERHTYPVTLDADWGSESVLKDEEALCLDATSFGNVARFINHRCYDANLIDIPVEVETPDRHYYHVALFTSRNVKANEELTWDYGIDFDDHKHPIKAFHCTCGSSYCRDAKRKGKRPAVS
ncbi:hypothetical protein COLO4_15515 [Corchorus olitorius]|uniref:SET domain-containing protein n=1 Tax=Corchorus olitorius TaxID=93759 RepID=A0A1R3JMX9_9ROSI|nr:hypothetical protein COLO4_15515 [Corchorus olitorius]